VKLLRKGRKKYHVRTAEEEKVRGETMNSKVEFQEEVEGDNRRMRKGKVEEMRREIRESGS